MQTQEVPKHEWVPFLDDFSKRHVGDRVTVEVLGAAVGSQRAAEALPLVGVSVDLRDGGDNEQIEVIAGDSPHAHVMHAIPRPSQVRLARGDNGVDEALQIESEDGVATLVRLLQ
jgi:Family of unknown function (DUF5335)